MCVNWRCLYTLNIELKTCRVFKEIELSKIVYNTLASNVGGNITGRELNVPCGSIHILIVL